MQYVGTLYAELHSFLGRVNQTFIRYSDYYRGNRRSLLTMINETDKYMAGWRLFGGNWSTLRKIILILLDSHYQCPCKNHRLVPIDGRGVSFSCGYHLAGVWLHGSKCNDKPLIYVYGIRQRYVILTYRNFICRQIFESLVYRKLLNFTNSSFQILYIKLLVIKKFPMSVVFFNVDCGLV